MKTDDCVIFELNTAEWNVALTVLKREAIGVRSEDLFASAQVRQGHLDVILNTL